MGAISIRPNYSQTNHNVKKIQIHTTPSNSTRATQYPYTCICTLSNCKHRNFLSFPHLNVHFFMWILLSLSMCRFLQLRNRRFVVTVDSPFLTDFLFTYVHLHDWHILNLTHWTNKFRCNVVMRELNVGFANITIVVFHTALCIFNFDFAIVNEPHWISLVFFFAPILFADRIFSSSYWLLILCGWWQNHHLIPQINHKTTTTFPNVWAFKQFRHCKPISLNYTVKRCSRDFFGSVFFLPLITLFIPFCLVYWNCWPLLWWYSSGNSNTTHSVPLRTDRCAFYKSMCCW